MGGPMSQMFSRYRRQPLPPLRKRARSQSRRKKQASAVITDRGQFSKGSSKQLEFLKQGSNKRSAF